MADFTKGGQVDITLQPDGGLLVDGRFTNNSLALRPEALLAAGEREAGRPLPHDHEGRAA